MDQPIACTLTAAEYRDRTDALAGLAARALRWRSPTAEGERLVFAVSEETERALRAAIAAEEHCCSFLRMTLQRTDDGLVLDIAAPRAARRVVAELFVRSAG